jgi:hypothetical protein
MRMLAYGVRYQPTRIEGGGRLVRTLKNQANFQNLVRLWTARAMETAAAVEIDSVASLFLLDDFHKLLGSAERIKPAGLIHSYHGADGDIVNRERGRRKNAYRKIQELTSRDHIEGAVYDRTQLFESRENVRS